MASMFGRSGVNYAHAGAASTSAQRAITTQVQRLPAEAAVHPAPALPSAAGGKANLPGGWSLIESAVDQIWPDGHQDRLHRVASAWAASARVLEDAAFPARLSALSFALDDLPE